MRWNDNSLKTVLNIHLWAHTSGTIKLIIRSKYFTLWSLRKWSPIRKWVSSLKVCSPLRSDPSETTRGQCQANLTTSGSFWSLEAKKEPKEGAFKKWQKSSLAVNTKLPKPELSALDYYFSHRRASFQTSIPNRLPVALSKISACYLH